jgi:hypothetical protein
MPRAGQRGIWVRFPTGARKSFPLPVEGSSGPPILLSNGYQAGFPGVRWPRREADDTCLHSVVLNEEQGQIYLYFIV